MLIDTTFFLTFKRQTAGRERCDDEELATRTFASEQADLTPVAKIVRTEGSASGVSCYFVSLLN